MQDINGREIKSGHWLLYKVTQSSIASWIVRKVKAVDEQAQTIHLTGPNLNPNPSHNGQPSGDSTIHYATKRVPTRFLLVLDGDAPDNLLRLEEAGALTLGRTR